MTAPVDRHERARASWLLAHESPRGLWDRRMATELQRQADRKERRAAGAAESAHHEGRIKPIFARFVARGEDSKERLARGFTVAVGCAAGAVLAGPALALSHGLYAVTTDAALRKGRVPRVRPWLLAGAGTAAAGVLLRFLVQPGAVLTLRMPSMVLVVDDVQLALLYAWAQLSLGLLLTAWQVRRHGWPGVTVKATPSAPVMPAARADWKAAASDAPAAPIPTTLPVSTSAGPKPPALPHPMPFDPTPEPDSPDDDPDVEWDDELPAFDEAPRPAA